MKTWFDTDGLEVTSCGVDEAGPLIDVFHRIRDEKHWAADDMDDYLEHSTFFVAKRHGVIIGGAKVVRGNPDGLPVTRVWPEVGILGRTDIVDLALTALVERNRGSLKALGALWASIWRWCVTEGVSEIWMEVNPKNRRLYSRYLDAPIHIMGELRQHWGVPTYPCRVLLEEQNAVLDTRARGSQTFDRYLKHVTEQGERV